MSTPPPRLPDDLLASEHFVRVVGKRQRPAPGEPPNPDARAAMARMAGYRTRVPKGVFIYRSHEEANRDWERWLVDAIVARHE